MYELSEGWEPLCRFLEVPVPERKPFPRLNDTAQFQARIKRVSLILRVIAFGSLALIALFVAGLAALFLS